MSYFELDKLDRTILNELLKDATQAYTQIATTARVSDGTVHVRIKKMQNAGVICGSTSIINPKLIGFDVIALVGIYLEKSTDYNAVIKKLEAINNVVEAHYTSGVYSLFIKVICKNTTDLIDVLTNKIQSIKEIQRIETIISLENKIFRPMQLD